MSKAVVHDRIEFERQAICQAFGVSDGSDCAQADQGKNLRCIQLIVSKSNRRVRAYRYICSYISCHRKRRARNSRTADADQSRAR